MPQRAHVTSVEALDLFRASLIVYLGKARPALEGVGEEVRRTRLWLQNDRRIYWESQVHRRTKELEVAQQALFSAGLSNLRETTSAEQKAVHKARHALEEAAAKLKSVKRWSREFDSRAEPLVKQTEKLRAILADDLPQAINHLAEAIKALDAYANIVPSSTTADPSQRAEASPADTVASSPGTAGAFATVENDPDQATNPS